MNSELDTQEIMTLQPAKVSQVITIVKKAQSEETQIEEKPFKRLQVIVSSIPTSTIYLTHSREEDERVSLVPVTVEAGNGNDLHDFSNLFNGSNGKYSSPPPQP